MIDVGDLKLIPLLYKCEKEGSTHGEILAFLADEKEDEFEFNTLVDHCSKNKYVVQPALQEFIDAGIVEKTDGGFRGTGLINFQ